MPTYEDLGYNRLISKRRTSSLGELTEDISAYRNPQLPVSSVKGNISADQIETGIDNAVRRTKVLIGAAIISNNSGARLTTTLRDSGNNGRIMMAIAESTVYKGSIADGNEVPYGSNTIANNHKRHTAYDYEDNQESSSPNTGITYIDHVQNNSGSAALYYWKVRWRYIGSFIASILEA